MLPGSDIAPMGRWRGLSSSSHGGAPASSATGLAPFTRCPEGAEATFASIGRTPEPATYGYHPAHLGSVDFATADEEALAVWALVLG